MLSLKLSQFYPSFTFTILDKTPWTEEFDIILTDILDEEIARYPETIIIKLIDREIKLINSGNLNLASSHYYEFYKYGNVRELASFILRLFSDLTGKAHIPLRKERARTIPLLACKGGVGVSTLAIALSSAFSKYADKKSLYFSLEELLYFEKHKTIPGLEEFLYYYSQKSKMATQVETFTILDSWNYYRFNTEPGLNPLNEFIERELSALLDHIDRYGDFQYIFLDMANRAGLLDEEIFNQAYRVLLIYNDEKTHQMLGSLLRYFKNKFGADSYDKFVLIANNCGDSYVNECEYPCDHCIIDEISYDRAFDQRPLIFEGDFASTIKKLMKELT